MTKLLLIPALMFGSLALATENNYEITPLVGYNLTEGNIGLNNHPILGVEAQYNGWDFPIKPEVSILFSKADYSDFPDLGKDTNLQRFAFSGVYEFDKIGIVTPLAKAGVGYEYMSNAYSDNHSSPFIDAGIGAKIPFNDMFALKAEAIYMLKHNDARYDNNLAILVGLNIAFGSKTTKVIEVQEVKSVEEEKVQEAAVTAVAVIDGDDDNDGILNSKDKCPNTQANKVVNAEGCFIDGDDDKDGVLNSKDICPNTVAGEVVNGDGCPAKMNLNINFENNSFTVDSSSKTRIEKYARFLNTYTAYSAKIIGYTDSKGSAKYNQKLSQNRANAVKDMLIERGVDANRLSAIGMGEDNPIADNNTSEGRAQNRRIEAELTKK